MNFIHLQAQRQRIAPQIDAAVARVISACSFIMGPEVAAFEQALAKFAGAKHALACGNGTDALVLPLRAWGIGQGDAVFVPSFTFVATAEVPPSSARVRCSSMYYPTPTTWIRQASKQRSAR